MDFMVEKSNGDTFTVELRLYDSVINIKEQIQQSQGIPVCDQTLILGGVTLSDDAFVSRFLCGDVDFDSDNIPIDHSVHKSAESQIASAANRLSSSSVGVAVGGVNLHNSAVFAQCRIASVANQLPSSSLDGVNLQNSSLLPQPAIAAVENQKMRLSFLTPTTDRICDMEMNAADTIRELKQKIHTKLGISIKPLLLRFTGMDLLDENKSLMDYQIPDSSSITVWDRTVRNDFPAITAGSKAQLFAATVTTIGLYRTPAVGNQSNSSLHCELRSDPFFTDATLCWMIKCPDCILPVRDQGNSSTAVIYAEHILFGRGEPVESSVQELVDRLRDVYGEVSTKSKRKKNRKRRKVECEGNSLLNAFKYAEEYGLYAAELYPFVGDFLKSRPPPQIENAKKTFIKSFGSVNVNDTTITSDDIVKALEIRPLATTIAAGPNFDNWGSEDEIYRGKELVKKTVTNHAIMVVGYGADYFLCQNSGGTDFGRKGYIRVARDYVDFGGYVDGTIRKYPDDD